MKNSLVLLDTAVNGEVQIARASPKIPFFARCLSFSANRIGWHSPTRLMPSNHLTALAMMDLARLADLVEVCSRMLDLDGNHIAERGYMALILRSKLPHDGVIPTIGHIA